MLYASTPFKEKGDEEREKQKKNNKNNDPILNTKQRQKHGITKQTRRNKGETKNEEKRGGEGKTEKEHLIFFGVSLCPLRPTWLGR